MANSYHQAHIGRDSDQKASNLRPSSGIQAVDKNPPASDSDIVTAKAWSSAGDRASGLMQKLAEAEHVSSRANNRAEIALPHRGD